MGMLAAFIMGLAKNSDDSLRIEKNHEKLKK